MRNSAGHNDKKQVKAQVYAPNNHHSKTKIELDLFSAVPVDSHVNHQNEQSKLEENGVEHAFQDSSMEKLEILEIPYHDEERRCDDCKGTTGHQDSLNVHS